MNNFGIDKKFLYANTCITENPISDNKKTKRTVQAENSVRISLSRLGGYVVPVSDRGPMVAGGFATTSEVRKQSTLNWPKKVKEIRDKLGIKQVALARVLGISEDALGKLERGETKEPMKITRDKISKLLDVIEFVFKHNKQKKYLVISIFNSKLSALHELSPMEYLEKKFDDEYALNDLSGLFRRMYE